MQLKKEDFKKIYTGKTKDVYQYGEDKILLYTKDETTGWWKTDDQGQKYFVEDPGGNEVGPAVDGMGQKNLITSVYYFNKLSEATIDNHFIDADIDANLMLVKAGKVLGSGLECIIRYYAMGSLLRRFPDQYTEGDVVENFFETTLKSDADNDPPITKEELAEENIISVDEYNQVATLCRKAADLIQADLQELDLTLVDIKFEVGKVDNKIILIDEFSPGVMRVARGPVSAANVLTEEELAEVLLNRINK